MADNETSVRDPSPELESEFRTRLGAHLSLCLVIRGLCFAREKEKGMNEVGRAEGGVVDGCIVFSEKGEEGQVFFSAVVAATSFPTHLSSKGRVLFVASRSWLLFSPAIWCRMSSPSQRQRISLPLSCFYLLSIFYFQQLTHTLQVTRNGIEALLAGASYNAVAPLGTLSIVNIISRSFVM